MDVMPEILWGRVMHQRLHPARNGFSYPIYYLSLPLEWIEGAGQDAASVLPVNRRGFLSFHTRDHGARDRTPLSQWIQSILTAHGITNARHVTLISLPRVIGYVFNPVSFWIARDDQARVRAVLCEVNNTFGETHSYLCLPGAEGALDDQTWLHTPKVFHVSPFLPRMGSYQFRFALTGPKIGIWIDYYDAGGEKQLVTALTGHVAPLTRAAVSWAFWRYPLVTLGAMSLIHWQAIKLWVKRQKFYPKPLPIDGKITISRPKTTD